MAALALDAWLKVMLPPWEKTDELVSAEADEAGEREEMEEEEDEAEDAERAEGEETTCEVAEEGGGGRALVGEGASGG